jgi:1-acyl-sn-glycerol-3-phosphate acyltransferase
VSDWRSNRIWMVLMGAWGFLSAALICTLCCLAAPIIGPRRSFFGIGKLWTRQQFALCGVKWRVEGWPQIPEAIRTEKQPVVFMCNHESLLDSPFLVTAIPIPAVYIAKKEVRWMPGIGWAAWAAGMIFIDRKNRETAIAGLKRAAILIRGGKNVVIFPEGTRTRTGELGIFKKGGFNLALDAGVPIVPMAIEGAFGVLPPGKWVPRPGHFNAVFGEPVNPSEFPDMDTLIEEVRKRVARLIQGLKTAG